MNKDETASIKKRAIELAEGNELVSYCRSQGLYTRPEGSHVAQWLASCPSGGNHSIMISSASNQWGCGYCRKKGRLEELKQFMESRRRHTR